MRSLEFADQRDRCDTGIDGGGKPHITRGSPHCLLGAPVSRPNPGAVRIDGKVTAWSIRRTGPGPLLCAPGDITDQRNRRAGRASLPRRISPPNIVLCEGQDVARGWVTRLAGCADRNRSEANALTIAGPQRGLLDWAFNRIFSRGSGIDVSDCRKDRQWILQHTIAVEFVFDICHGRVWGA